MHFHILGHNVFAQFESTYSFSPFDIFCQITGKPIGRSDESEIFRLVHGMSTNDAEAICDDLALRIFASMRPSLRWNKMRAESLEEMRKSSPVETLAYLMNRLFAPLNIRKISFDHRLDDLHNRIKLFRRLTEWGLNDSTNTLLYMLLEVDAKWNLDTETAPFTAYDFLDSDADLATLVEMVQNWYVARVKDWDRKVARDALETRWHRSGNALSRPAFFAAFMESKPPSIAKIQAGKKAEESKFMQGLLAEITGVATQADVEAVKPKPVLIAVTRMPKAWGRKS